MTQQTYHAAPSHPLRDILYIHSLGYAIPWDGDHWVRYYGKADSE